MKNKKIIALICALSMIISVFAGLTVVNAADKGVALETTKTDDTNYTVTAKYVGYDNGISGANLKISVPEGATVTASTPLAGALASGKDNGDGTYTYVIGLGDNTKGADDVFAVFEIKLASALSADFDVEIKDGNIDELDEDYEPHSITVADGTLAASTTLATGAAEEPTEAPSTPTQAPSDDEDAPLPKPASDPSVTAPPKSGETKAPAEVTKGIQLAADKTDDTHYTVTATYVGFDNGISGANITITVPAGATVTPNTPLAGALASGKDNGDGTYTYVIGLGDNTKAAGDVIATYGIELASALAEDFEVIITDGNIDELDEDYEPHTISGDDLVKAYATLVAKEAEPVDADAELGDLVDADAAKKDAASDDVYVALEVTKADGTPATYGEDYVAYYDNTPLTKAQLDNYLTGTYEDVADAIPHISFTYNDGVNVRAQVVKNNKVVDDSKPAASPTPVPGTATPTPVPGTPTATPTPGNNGGGNGGSGSGSKGGVIANGNNSGTVVNPYDPSINFRDLGSVSWAEPYINELASRGIINGRDEYTFDPNANITRAEYAQIIVGALGQSNISADVSFDDVATDAWYYHAVAVAYKLGIIEGYGDGNFGPNDLITREQMALMTQKAAVYAGKSLAAQSSVTFTDDADIADWSRDAVYALANAGIINGMGDGTFAPKANATRAQAAVIIDLALVR